MLLINIDMSQFNELSELGDSLKNIAHESARDLAGMIESRAKELAAEKLHTRRDMFVKGLHSKAANGDGDTFIVSLDAKVRWIDDGQPAWEMLQALLNTKKQNHRDKDGNRYVIIPFNHSPGKGKTGATAAQQDLINVVRSELSKRKIPFGKFEKGADGQDKIGRLHTFDIMHAPKKADMGPGQRRGPVGEVMQGNTGTPFLQGVTVYQSKDDKGKTKRSILTFRIVSEKHRSQAKWEHPGNAPTDILEQAAQWAVDTWEKEIAGNIIDKAIAAAGKG